MAYFPMFVDITGQKCLVVGGGRVALRKVQVLLDFDAKILVVAKEISDDIKAIAAGHENASDSLFLQEKEFEEDDIEGAALVVVATNDNSLNGGISALCRKKGIPVNVVDDKEKCSFIFPSYIKEKDLVGAFSSGGNSPVIAKYLKDKASTFLTSDIGELNDILGKWRPKIIDKIDCESSRKRVFERIVDSFIETGVLPSDDEIRSTIDLFMD